METFFTLMYCAHKRFNGLLREEIAKISIEENEIRIQVP